MRRTLVPGCCVIATLLILGTVYAQNNKQQGQGIGLVVAALKSQLHASGKTLEATYQYQSTGGDVLEVKYTRTPTRVMFIEIVGPYIAEQSSYSPATAEVRRFERLKATNKLTGTVSADLDYPLRTSIVMDPVLYFVWEGFLLDKIRGGILADSKEDIDGHACYRIDITPVDKTYEPYTVWVDPEIGYCPRQIIQHTEKPSVAKLSDYVDLGGGIWFPKKIVRAEDMPIMRKKYPKRFPSDTVELVSNVIDVRLVKTDSAHPPIVEFPSGTKVTDEITGKTFTVQ